MPHLRRIFVAALVSSALVWLGSGSALAAGNPGRTFVPPPNPYTAPVCGATVGDVTFAVDPDTYRAYVKTYTMSDGTTRLKFNGFQAATVSGNGKTLHFNISGPGTVLLDGATLIGLIGNGHSLYIGPPGTTQPGIRLYTGRVVFAVEPSGNAIVTSHTGNATDICALLAG